MRELTRRRAVAELSCGKFRGGRREVYSAKLPATCHAAESPLPPSALRFLRSGESRGSTNAQLPTGFWWNPTRFMNHRAGGNLHSRGDPNLFRLSCKPAKVAAAVQEASCDPARVAGGALAGSERFLQHGRALRSASCTSDISRENKQLATGRTARKIYKIFSKPDLTFRRPYRGEVLIRTE